MLSHHKAMLFYLLQSHSNSSHYIALSIILTISIFFSLHSHLTITHISHNFLLIPPNTHTHTHTHICWSILPFHSTDISQQVNFHHSHSSLHSYILRLVFQIHTLCKSQHTTENFLSESVCYNFQDSDKLQTVSPSYNLSKLYLHCKISYMYQI